MIDIRELRPPHETGIRHQIARGLRIYVHAYSVEAAKALRGHAYSTLWPAARYSENIGPHSEQESIRRWKADSKKRDGIGRGWEIGIDNSARDDQGKRYVGRVNEGRTSRGTRVTRERHRANYHAAQRTIARHDMEIGRRAKTRAETRKTRLR